MNSEHRISFNADTREENDVSLPSRYPKGWILVVRVGDIVRVVLVAGRLPKVEPIRENLYLSSNVHVRS